MHNLVTAETWIAIVGYEGTYEVSDLGRVRSLDREEPYRGTTRRRQGRIIKASAGNYGHLAVKLTGGGRTRGYGVHRLVLEAFVGPCPLGMQGCHNDEDPSNNRLSNLRWDTPKNNQADSHRSGRAFYARYKTPTVKQAAEMVARELEESGQPESAAPFRRLADLLTPQERAVRRDRALLGI